MTNARPHHGVNTCYEALGLRSFGNGCEDSNYVTRRSKFKFEPVHELCSHELPALYGRLLHDAGTGIDRGDPNLFDEELEEILTRLGPLIWPQPGLGSRDHLRQPDTSTHYPIHLVYPRDTSTLKTQMRNVLLMKRPPHRTINLDALIEKWAGRDLRAKPQSAVLKPKSQGVSGKTARPLPARGIERLTMDNDGDSTSHLEHASPVIETRQEASQRSNGETSDAPLQIKMRLYRIMSSILPPVLFLGNILIDGDCTSDKCFSRITAHAEAEFDWIVFQLPEDISRQAKVRIRHRSQNSEADFQGVLDLFRRSHEVRGGSIRSVEVEVGLDIGVD